MLSANDLLRSMLSGRLHCFQDFARFDDVGALLLNDAHRDARGVVAHVRARVGGVTTVLSAVNRSFAFRRLVPLFEGGLHEGAQAPRCFDEYDAEKCILHRFTISPVRSRTYSINKNRFMKRSEDPLHVYEK